MLFSFFIKKWKARHFVLLYSFQWKYRAEHAAGQSKCQNKPPKTLQAHRPCWLETSTREHNLLRVEQLRRMRGSSMNSLWRSSLSPPQIVGNRRTTLTDQDGAGAVISPSFRHQKPRRNLKTPPTKMRQKPHKPVLSPPRKNKKPSKNILTPRIDMDLHGADVAVCPSFHHHLTFIHQQSPTQWQCLLGMPLAVGLSRPLVHRNIRPWKQKLIHQHQWVAGGSLASGPSINRSFMILMLIIISWHTFPVRSWLGEVGPARRSLGNIIILLVVPNGWSRDSLKESGQESKSTVLPPLDTRQAILNKDGNVSITLGCFPNVSNPHGHFSYIMFPHFHAGQQHVTFIQWRNVWRVLPE